MMMIKPEDDRAESVMYPFILILALCLVLGFMINGLSQYAVSGQMSQVTFPGMTNPFGLKNMTTIVADSTDDRYVAFESIEGYLVSDDDILDYVPYPTDNDPFIFWEDDDPTEKKYVHIIRNNRDYDPDSTEMWEMYRDFVAIRRHTDAFAWDPQWNDAAVPFTALAANFNNLTNASTTTFQLSGSQDAIFINSSTGPGLTNFTNDLWANNFNIFYGWSLFRLSELDFWGAVAMAFYADIPGVNDTVDWLIHAFVIGAVIFLVFTMATRLIPFIGD